MQPLTTCLWFDGVAEDAARFYTSVFKESKLGNIVRAPKGVPNPEGTVMVVEFGIKGQKFIGLNGGPNFKFSEAVSLVINCATQEEIDYYWERLTADGGQEGPCGWLKDKFGLSWQVTPDTVDKLIGSGNKAKSEAAMGAVMGMKKLDMAAIQAAYDNA